MVLKQAETCGRLTPSGLIPEPAWGPATGSCPFPLRTPLLGTNPQCGAGRGRRQVRSAYLTTGSLPEALDGERKSCHGVYAPNPLAHSHLGAHQPPPQAHPAAWGQPGPAAAPAAAAVPSRVALPWPPPLHPGAPSASSGPGRGGRPLQDRARGVHSLGTQETGTSWTP